MGPPNKIDLFKALERDEIVPYFQPLVELNSGRLTGFEVLARWHHPAYGMVSPDHFIPVAEESGLIGVLSEKLLRKVFLAAPAIPHPLTISFNISTIEFHDPNLPKQIQQAATDGGFPLSRLILEVTESALIGNLQDVLAITQELKRLGVRLALDDFGTAYSSLRHLQSLPFDELKVDASFVRSMDHTRESRKIAAAVVGLGHSLGLVTVGEGIETRTQAEMLLWLGCDQGQGWLFGRPVPAEGIAGIVAKEFLGNEEVSAPSTADEFATSVEALPEQRLAHLQAIYDGAPVGLCFLDTAMRYVNVNRRLAEMNGVSVANHLGRRIHDVLPETFMNFIEPYVRRALAGESLSDIEVRDPAWWAEGRFITRLLSYEPARDEAGEVVGVEIAVVDITARKMAEEALRESEDHYRHAVELSPHIPWTYDPSARKVEISPRWEKVTGLPMGETDGWVWLTSLHPEDADRTRAAVIAALETGETIDVEYRMRVRDGEWRWMRSRGSPRRDATGKIIRWYGNIEDIDEYKQSEQALVKSDALLKAVFDTVPVGLLVTASPGGRILMSNPQTEKIFSRPMIEIEKVADYRSSGARHPDGRIVEHDEYPLSRAMATGEPAGPEEFLLHRADGTDLWISATVTPIRDVVGDVVGGVVAFQDIDELKRDQRALQDCVSDLRNQLTKSHQ